MRAIVFDPAAPPNFTFGDVAAPVASGPDELLIEVKAVSLNFGEVFSVGNVENPGDIPGWDSAGVVLTAAADGSGPPVGARVVGADWSRAWAQRRVIKSGNVATIPDSTEFETAAALSVAGVTALQSVRRLGSVVGLRELGADEVVVGLEGLTPVHGVLEHVGGEMLADAFHLLTDGGRVVSVGAASGQPTLIDFEAARMTLNHKRIETFMVAWPLGRDLNHVVQFAEKGQLDAQIGYRDSWHNFDAAIDALLGRKVAGKVALAVS